MGATLKLRHQKKSKLILEIGQKAVVDSNKRFTLIDAGFPGSAHDSRVFKSTVLYNTMINSKKDFAPSTYYHLVGDSAFQLSVNVMGSFKDYGNLSNLRRKYNTKWSQTRDVIENAFGLLKGRFRRLKYVDTKVDKIPNIIKACCILHNITLGTRGSFRRGILAQRWCKSGQNGDAV